MVKNMKFRRNIKLLIACVLACCCIFAASNVRASNFGYIYDSNGKPMRSSVGFILNENDVFNINSEAWKGLGPSDISGLTDLFVYNNGIEEKIYIVDGVSNSLFVFDEEVRFLEKVTKFELYMEEFVKVKGDQLASELSKIKTNVIVDKNSNTRQSKLLEDAIVNFWDNVNKSQEYDDTDSDLTNNRPEEYKIYIETRDLSCVYRALRPGKDEYGINDGTYQDVIYLCDKGNAQILVLDTKTYKVIDVITAPEKSDFYSKFAPKKMVIDSSGRMYVISEGVYEGIILLNYNGDFMRYVGVNYTTLSFWQALTRNLKTEEQLAQESAILSTEFNNLTIDEKNFLYTVARASVNPITQLTDDSTMVKKINQIGDDVLIRNGYSNPKGDLVTIRTGQNAGGSVFVGITVNEFGLYTVVDSKMGRLFTYDSEGNLLYISGGKGVEQTDIKTPVAVRYQGENVLVLDQGNSALLRFELTDFAKSINKATEYQFNGQTDKAADEWENVITQNPNYQLAYVGVGKTLHEEGRYKEAMAYFELGDNPAYYSRAYKKYRDEIIKEYFPIVLYGTVVLVIGLLGLKVYKKIKNKNPDTEGEVI